MFMPPSSFLRQLYVRGSLKNVDLNGDGKPEGFSLKLRNTLAGGTVRAGLRLRVDGVYVDPSNITVTYRGERIRASEARDRTLYFAVGDEMTITAELGRGLEPGEHTVEFEFDTVEYGTLGFDVTDTVG